MHFLIIFGPAAVGKMTVGDEITKLSGIPVFHNHLSIEPVLRFFEFGTPSFQRVVDGFRKSLVEEVAKSDLPGLIFTFVWNLDADEDLAFVEEICGVFDREGAQVTLIELKADQEQRLSRNRTEKRLSEKPSKRNVDWSEQNLINMDDLYTLNSESALDLPYRHLVIDNTHRQAADVASEIVKRLNIPSKPH